MKVSGFITDDFLLKNKTASFLFHNYASKAPIFDYHCHLNPGEIYKDKKYNDITELWLGGDHYKWRLMRANGVDEEYITGSAGNFEKFKKWAETLSRCMGNPLYHWSHLELKRYFGIDELLNADTAPKIWDRCNEMLKEEGFSARSLIVRSNVKGLCTTDDPCDDLICHRKIKEDSSFNVQVLPTFRPDKALNIEKEEFAGYIRKLSEVSDIDINSFDTLVEALEKRARYFREAGCVLSDQSFGSPDFSKGTLTQAKAAFDKALRGEVPGEEEINAYKTQLMLALGRIYNKLGFAMQLHLGVIRNINTRMAGKLGPDTGFDSIGDGISATSLAALLDGLEKTGELPRTIVYCLNDNDNDKIMAVIGSFQTCGIKGKMQLGSAWWFNDHLDGMEKQLKSFANTGILANFVGMLTDSRSFLSYTRHEYFRRILCNLIGGWAEDGLVPKDNALLGKMVEDICFNNIVNYLGIK